MDSSDQNPPAPERERIQELVIRCLSLFEQEGERAVDRVCQEHPDFEKAVRARIEGLREMGFLVESEEQVEERLPERIGSFRLIRKLGTGGMGVVYEAEQDEPRRTVALKLIRIDRLSPRARQRFAQEVEVLGHLQHPGIAQVYEVGSAETEWGTIPYFAMEMVRGLPLHHYAEQHELDCKGRIDLLARVCDAVQHAHQKGVIHRDLKPGNILVDENGQPRILDFGLARVTDADLQHTSLQTNVGQILGTLPYMSPEQAGADPTQLDTRSDVYALGVLAYQLLSGVLPLDLEGRVMLDAVRIIQEEEPSRLGSHDRELRGDVETIVAKALEKDKGRRYQSAGDLASDLRRYLSDEPVLARPPSTLYQVQKFAQRNRALVAGICVAFLALIVGLTGTVIGLVQATQARDASRRSEERTRAVLDFQTRMLSSVDPERDGRLVTVATILDQAAEELRHREADDAEVEASIRLTIGVTYRALGLYPEAEEQVVPAWEILQAELGPDHPRTLFAMTEVGELRRDQGHLDEAEKLQRSALSRLLSQPLEDPTAPLHVKSGLGLTLRLKGQFDQAGKLFEDALEECERTLGPEHFNTVDMRSGLASVRILQGRFKEAESLLQNILELRRRDRGEAHPRTLNTLSDLASVMKGLGRLEEAEQLARKLVEQHLEQLGERHMFTLAAMNNHAVFLKDLGRRQESLVLQQKVARLRQEVLGPDHHDTLRSRANLTALLIDLGRLEEAETLARKVLQDRQRLLGEDHFETLDSYAQIGHIYSLQNRDDEAEPFLWESAERARETLGEEHWLTGVYVMNHGACLYRLDEFEDSEEELLEAHQILRDTRGEEDTYAQMTVGHLINLYQRWGRPEELRRWQARQ